MVGCPLLLSSMGRRARSKRTASRMAPNGASSPAGNPPDVDRRR
jgi:hypothetical protein